MWVFLRPLVKWRIKAILKKLHAVSMQWLFKCNWWLKCVIPWRAFRSVTSRDSVPMPTWNLPYPVAPPFESAATNWPTALAVPCAASSNWISDTIMLSSITEPQFVHTASPRPQSTSMSDEPQFLHFKLLDIVPLVLRFTDTFFNRIGCR